MNPASVADYRELARRRLPPMFFEYIDGGSYAEVTLERNVADIEALALRQRVMRDMTQLDLSVEVLGQKMAMPTGASPTGMESFWPKTSTDRSSWLMSRITRWRRAMASMSATFRRRVASA